jgi:predicted XRE-type DNA-binding protein
MSDSGFAQAEIADAVGLSRSRVSQILGELRASSQPAD